MEKYVWGTLLIIAGLISLCLLVLFMGGMTAFYIALKVLLTLVAIFIITMLIYFGIAIIIT